MREILKIRRRYFRIGIGTRSLIILTRSKALGRSVTGYIYRSRGDGENEKKRSGSETFGQMVSRLFSSIGPH